MLTSFRPHLPLIGLSCLSALVIFYLYRELQRAKRSVACLADREAHSSFAPEAGSPETDGAVQDKASRANRAEVEEQQSGGSGAGGRDVGRVSRDRKRQPESAQEESEVKRVRFREAGAQGTPLPKRRSVPTTSASGAGGGAGGGPVLADAA